METDDWLRLRSAFDRVVDVPAEQRALALERECNGDRALHSRLVRLLEADSSEELELRGPPSLESLLDGPSSGLAAGTRLGPFVLIEPIAVGGMGTVWLAEQQQPKRRVALKTLRAELGGVEAQKRFRAEAELLAHLSHPGIAQVFGAGTALLDGRAVPYIAMEYVEGSHGLVEWAEDRRLERDARLRLFIETCEAVHHGHVRGVIHRDLKPGNVLVDPAGHAKVIDFGLARALDAEGLEVSVAHTRAGDILGTLAYMSPEHVGGQAYAVDARSDVYALGCILCELVTGRPPIAVEGLPLTEVARRITEAPPQIAEVRPVDLRWVLAKALEKDPARRYASASEFAADVQRVLDGWPILARPPSTLYELGKLMRRHRALLVATTAVLIALSIGLLQARREARAADRARDVAEQALLDAQRQRALAQETARFVVEVFLSSSIYERGRDARVVDALDRAQRGLPTVPDETVRAILSSLVGSARVALEERGVGEPLVRQASEVLRANLARDDYFRLLNETVLADLLELDQRFEESRALSLEVLPLLERELGPEHANTLYLRFNLAVCELRLGRPAEAEALFRRNLELIESNDRLGDRSASRRDLHHRIGSCRASQDDAEGALEELEKALELAQDSPVNQATIHMDLGRVWMQLDDLDTALEEYERAAALYASLPPSFVHRYALANNRAEVLIRLGRFDEASAQLDLAQRALEEGWREPGLRHFLQAEQRARLALEAGRVDQARELAADVRAMLEQAGLVATSHEAVERLTAARILLAAGNAREAEQAAAAARALLERLGSTAGVRYAQAGEVLARARRELGEAD